MQQRNTIKTGTWTHARRIGKKANRSFVLAWKERSAISIPPFQLLADDLLKLLINLLGRLASTMQAPPLNTQKPKRKLHPHRGTKNPLPKTERKLGKKIDKNYLKAQL